jgi:hypothetical protein
VTGSYDFDIGYLEDAVQTVTERQDSLRTSFVYTSNGLTSVVAKSSRRTQVARLSLNSDAGTSTASIENMISAFASEDWNLADGPLFRIGILKLDSAHSVLLFCIHHLVADGESVLIFLNELLLFYKRLITESGEGPPPVPMNYQQYAVQYKSWLKTAAAKAAKQYWMTRGPSALDTKRPTDGSPQYITPSVLREDFERSRLLRIRRYASSLRVTPFEVMLSGFAAMMAGALDMEELVIGVPARRRDRQVEGTIGCFGSPLPIGVSVPKGGAFEALVLNLSLVLRRAQEYATLSMADIQHVDRSAPRINMIFNYLPGPISRIYSNLSEVDEVRMVWQPNDVAFFLTVWEGIKRDGTLCTFRREYVDVITAQNWVQRFWHTLSEAVE